MGVANHRIPFRKKMNGKPSRLSKVQYDKLAMLGFKEVIKNQKNKYEKEDDVVMVSQEDAKKSDRWDENYENLKKYKNKHGDCLVPKDYKDDPRLGNWMGNHRIPFRKKMNGKPSRLSNAQYDKLAMLGFEEVIKNKSEKEDDVAMVSQEDAKKSDRWDENYENLKKYKNKYGSCLVPKDYKDDPRLGNWVANHRVPFRKKMNGKPSRLS